MDAWEYRTVGAPAATDIETIGALLDKFGGQGWEYVGHLDRDLPAPAAPEAKAERGGVLLGGAKKGVVAVQFLIFKRPKRGTNGATECPAAEDRAGAVGAV